MAVLLINLSTFVHVHSILYIGEGLIGYYIQLAGIKEMPLVSENPVQMHLVELVVMGTPESMVTGGSLSNALE